ASARRRGPADQHLLHEGERQRWRAGRLPVRAQAASARNRRGVLDPEGVRQTQAETLTAGGKGPDVRKSLISAVVVIVLASCGGGQGGPAPTDYQTLVNNAGEYYENQTEIEVQGQIVELVESADYAELGEVTKPDADVVLTVESFLLNLGDPLPDPTLKKLHKVFTEDGVFGDDAGTVLKDTGEDLDLVLVRWTAPPDIPQRRT